MRKSYRRGLLIAATISFFTLAPLLVLYAMGYRLYYGADGSVSVGVVVVETYPRRAEVTVDGTMYGKTPRAVANLRPGTATISITKEGYGAWQKTAQIEPGRTYELRDVRLFLENPNFTQLAENVHLFSIAPNRQLLAIVNEQRQITVTDDTGTVVAGPLKLPADISSMLWSPDSSMVALTSHSSWWLLDLGQPTSIQPLPSIQNSAQVMWDLRLPARLLVRTENGLVQGFSVRNGRREVLLKDVRMFTVSGRRLYAIHTSNSVAAYDLRGTKEEDLSIAVDQPILTVRVSARDHIAYTLADGSVWLRDNTGGSAKISSDVQSLSWSPDGHIVLLAPDEQSLYVYNVSDERAAVPLHELSLVARLSRAIISPQWYAGGRHILYQVDDEVLITEIDTRDRATTYQVDTTNNGKSSPAVNEDGSLVFYLKAVEGTTTLMAAEVAEL